jgi:hypothetical protein
MMATVRSCLNGTRYTSLTTSSCGRLGYRPVVRDKRLVWMAAPLLDRGMQGRLIVSGAWRHCGQVCPYDVGVDDQHRPVERSQRVRQLTQPRTSRHPDGRS